MSARRIARALARPIKRLVRAWRLKHAEYLIKHSEHELQRLADMRQALTECEAAQHRQQVHLAARRMRLERGLS